MRVIDHDDVVRAARRQFIASYVDIELLAADLAVSRATLYRVITSQDRLIGDVLWQLASNALAAAVRAAEPLRGPDRIVAISQHFESGIREFEPMQRWVRTRPLQASRVLFTPAGAVHERLVKAWAEIFVAAEASGELTLPCDADSLAYLYVRLGETLLHGELLAGVKADPVTAERIRRAMLEA